MYKLKAVKKILSIMTCSVIALAAAAVYPANDNSGSRTASAITIDEIQQEREANQAKIEEYQNQINSLEGSKESEEQYQSVLNEQIALLKENITLLNTELDSIKKDIEETESRIEQMDESIVAQQEAIDQSIELFKERLCAMYVSGNENLASVVLGSSSFYDILSRVEMANRMATYDEELIDDILSDIDDLENTKSELEQEKLTLEMKKRDQEMRKEEKDKELEEFNEKMRQTTEEIERIQREQDMLAGDAEKLKENNALLDQKEAELAEIARQAELERQRKLEEAERQRQAEIAAEQARQAEIANQQQSAGNSQTETPQTETAPSNTETYTPPTPSSGSGGFIWPAPGFCYISSGYGYRWGRNHNGIDVGDAGIMGGTAVAAKSGTVISTYNLCTHNEPKNYSCGCNGGFGNYVMIQHDDGSVTLYGHLSYASVSVGDYVSQGQAIGAIGSTGWSTGAHLHFEIHIGGVACDPLLYVSP